MVRFGVVLCGFFFVRDGVLGLCLWVGRRVWVGWVYVLLYECGVVEVGLVFYCVVLFFCYGCWCVWFVLLFVGIVG